MRKSNLRLLIILIVLLPFAFSGCWDYMEYEDLALVSAIGIDTADSGQVAVTLQYLIPGGGQGGGGSGGGGHGGIGKSARTNPNVAIVSATGPTIIDAVDSIQQYLDKKLFYGYMEVLIIGEDAARSLLTDFISLNDRTPQLRTTAKLAIAEGKARDAVSTVESSTTTSPGHYISEAIDKSAKTGNTTSVIVQDFIEYMEEEGVEPVAPRIKTYNSEAPGGGENSGKPAEGASNVVRIKARDGYHSISGIAIIKVEKLAGWFNKQEAKGFSWITGKQMVSYESHKTIPGAKSNGILNYSITKSKSRIKAGLDNGKPSITLDVSAKSAKLRKYVKTIESDDLTPDTINLLQKDLEETIRAEIDAALKKGQKDLKTDVFGFGQAFYTKYPSLWHSTLKDKWDEIFPDIPVTVNVKAKLNTTGTTIKKFFLK
ncbi:MAG TPA: Ger(x)C family spore germination protein [Clostridia bacterium]|nr:Ger(x)C family spore germination protein [Clostridia bacterium]